VRGLRLGASGRRDDQPLTRLSAGVEAGWFATPRVPIVLHIEPMRFRRDAGDRDVWWSRVEVRRAGAGRGIEAAAGAGVLSAPGVDGDWTAHGRVAVRPGAGVAAGIEARRAPYLWTTASIADPPVPEALRAFATWSARGVEGEAAVERQWFPDDNAVSSAFAWTLLPLVNHEGVLLQAGYAISAEDARESRFILANPVQLVPPGHTAFDTTGRYVPYYTPARRRGHAVLGALTAWSDGGARLHLGGSYSVRTTELAPAFTLAAGGVQRVFVSRESHPWEARATVDLPAGRRVTVSIGAEAGRQAFYDWDRVLVAVVFRARPDARPAGR
jgi:hypothetical protein